VTLLVTYPMLYKVIKVFFKKKIKEMVKLKITIQNSVSVHEYDSIYRR